MSYLFDVRLKERPGVGRSSIKRICRGLGFAKIPIEGVVRAPNFGMQKGVQAKSVPALYSDRRMTGARVIPVGGKSFEVYCIE